jgi:transaldolase/glucose-6-phosphate isomerase
MTPQTATPSATATSAKNPFTLLAEQKQSVWFDFIRKSLIDSGELQRLIEQDGLAGVTSNPAIFEKAIASSGDYADALAKDKSACASDPKGVYERIAIADIQRAADVLRPAYQRTKRRDGYVSLEVSPKLALDTAGTIDEARRLWKSVGRENVMIKVPGTKEGIPAIRTLISEGINVNVTLLFAIETYTQVADAYIAGLEALAKNKGDIAKVASVASFFVSRIDTMVDAELAAKAKAASNPSEKAQLEGLMGKVAIANAKLAFQAYLELVKAPRWQALAKQGAMPQRLLWASTGTKDARYRDVLYVEELIGPDTVNTIPPATFDAFRDHGKVRPSLTEDVAGAKDALAALAKTGVSLQKVTSQLVVDGVKLFVDAFDKLLAAVAKQSAPSAKDLTRLAAALPGDLAKKVDATLADWKKNDKTNRLWNGDAKLWTGTDEGAWLGWLKVASHGLNDAAKFDSIAREVRERGWKHILLLGMGGSSLCPEVLAKTFGRQQGFPEFLMLDSTDPQQIAALEKRIDVKSTLFIVSSKSGSTLEPNIFKQYFFERTKAAVGPERAGKRFVAITDPGSQMEKVAETDRFAHVFHGLKSIGGRYSALSAFGMVPAAAMGIDSRALLMRADETAYACAGTVAPENNPGVKLGAILGTAAVNGRDKVTIVASSGIRALGAWLEQLLAESTGKEGKALIPVDLEPLGDPGVYGDDRVFVFLSLAGDKIDAEEKKLAALEKAGHPVIRIALRDKIDVAAEFFRWEIATAVAGEVLRIDPFNQPDVEASKIATRKLTSAFEQAGSLPPEKPIFEGEGVRLFTDERNAKSLAGAAGAKPTLASYLAAHFARLAPADYAAILAYVEMNPDSEAKLTSLRTFVRDTKKVATCLGFGPRFLHSTGQAYKGGPNTGVVLQITCDDKKDIPVPGQKYTFGIVKAAQARGDFTVLSERGRRALRVHLGADLQAGLTALDTALRQALK